MREYCAFYFGEASAEPMIAALYQLEQNLVAPLETNPGIARYYALVKEAGDKMPTLAQETRLSLAIAHAEGCARPIPPAQTQE